MAGPMFKKITPPAINELFSLSIRHSKLRTSVTMFIFSPIIHTKDLPKTYAILKRRLPSIIKAKCFNDAHLPFKEELRKTEIGHLFEHLIIEYMCRLKLGSGAAKASFRGLTKWNWLRDPRGTFHLTIHHTEKENALFEEALGKSTQLLREIMESNPRVESGDFGIIKVKEVL